MATTTVNPGQGAGEGTGTGAGTPQNHSAAGNTGISAEEVERRLAEARRDEKAKLYPEIERQKTALQEKERQLADLKAALEAAQEGSRKAQTLEQQITSLTGQVNSMTEQFSKALDDALENQRKQFEEQRRKDQLAAKREALLSSTTELIPGMVTGNTPEELQANFEASKAEYKRIAEAAAEKARKELGAPLREALPKPVTPGSEAGESAAGDTEGGLESWRNMSPQEWEQKKRAIKQKIFADAGLPMKQR
jgi:DNA repair exonuclease SbcCD ATPase subunit